MARGVAFWQALTSDSPSLERVNGATASAADRTTAGRRLRWGTDLSAALLFLLLGIGLVLYPYVTGREMPGEILDNRMILAMLEFFNRSLVALFHGQSAHFLDAPFLYPWPQVTSFSETFWGDGIFYVLLRALRLDPLRSFQLWYVLGFALTYLTTFISFRVLGLRAWGAAAGAFLFTFPLPMTDQAHHSQLVYRLWIPPAIAALDRFLGRQSLRAGSACILFLALQIATCVYLGLFLCLLLAAYGVALLLVGRDRIAPVRWDAIRSADIGEVLTAGLILAAGLLVLAVVGIPYLHAEAMYGFTRSWQHDVSGVVPRIHSYLLTRFSMIWPNLSARYHYFHIWEHQMFPGLSAVIPLAWFVCSKRARAGQRLAAPMLVTFAILFAITLDLHGHTLYKLIYLIPGFAALREIARVILVMMLPLAALFGMLIDYLLRSATRPWLNRVLAIGLSVFVVAECSLIHHLSSSPAEWRRRIAALESRLPPKLPPHAILAVADKDPTPGAWALHDLDAQLVAVLLGIHTVNGYTSNTPPGWRFMATCHDVEENLRAGRKFLADHGFPAPPISSNQVVLVGFSPCHLPDLDNTPH